MDKNRDTEEIEAFCAEFERASQSILESAYRLKSVAGEVEEGLPDELGARATGRVKEFADKIIQLVSEGKEPVKKLRIQNREIGEEVLQLIKRV